MIKNFVDVTVTPTFQYAIRPPEYVNSYQDFPLGDLIDDLYVNSDVMELLLEDEAVNTSRHEFTPIESNLIQIRCRDLLGSVFWMSLDDLTSINDAVSIYRDLSTRKLEVGLIFSEPECCYKSSISASEFEGHAYQNMEKLEEDIGNYNKNFDEILLSLDNYNKLNDRYEFFEKIIVAGNLKDENKSDFETNQAAINLGYKITQRLEEFYHQTAELNENVMRIDSGSTHNSEKFIEPDIYGIPETSLPQNISIKVTANSNLQETESFEMMPKPSGSKHDSEQIIESHTHDISSTSLPPKEFNAVGTLSEFLVDQGAKNTLKFKDEEHFTTTNSTYSNSVSFIASGIEYTFDSDTRWKSKKDAKNHVAYKACLALGLPKPKMRKNPTKMSGKCYKNVLQEKLQVDERYYSEPQYTKDEKIAGDDTETEGFAARVTIWPTDRGTYQSFTSTKKYRKMKEAEKDAAEVAFNSLFGC